MLLVGAGFGVLWGATFGFAGHSRKRDFSALAATRYDLIARDGTVDQARAMLSNAGLLSDRENQTAT